MDEKQAAQKLNADKGNDAPQGKKRISGKAIAAIVIVILIAGVCAFYYFNLLGFKTHIVDFFKEQDPAYQTAIAGYNEKKEEYEQKHQELAEKEESLKQREAKVSEAEAEQEKTLASGTGGGSKSAAAIAPVFEQMDKSAAAEIFNNTTSDSWIAEILSSIDEKKAAEILGAMDPAKASAVSQLMS